MKSMEQIPSWKAESYSASQEITRLLCNPRVHYRVQKTRYWSQSWARWIVSTFSYPISLRFILILSTNLRLYLPSGLFPSEFLTTFFYAFVVSPCVLHAPSISSSLTWPPNSTWWSVQFTKNLQWTLLQNICALTGDFPQRWRFKSRSSWLWHLRNVAILPREYTALQPRRQRCLYDVFIHLCTNFSAV
jgi:hypothetical protein